LESIRHKIIEKGGLHYQTFRVCSFVDYTMIGASRPGAGSCEPGLIALRYNQFIQ
jgi:hypothetical protein